MKTLKFILPITFTLMIAFSCMQAFAQNDSCIIKLKNANTGFEQGDYDGTIKLLRSALAGCNLDKADKIAANKLLIMSYFKVDNLEEADKAAAAIMKADPNYKPDKFKDDPKLSALFDKYKPTPVLKIGLSAGLNFLKLKVGNTYSIVHADDATQFSHYTTTTGFQIGAQASYRIIYDLWVEAGYQFRTSNYKHTLDSVEGTTVNYSEKLTYSEIPLSLKYSYVIKNISPYAEAGGTFSFLSQALSTTTRDDQKDLINRTDYRNTKKVGWFGGIGVAYKLTGMEVFAGARYTKFSQNVNRDGTRYADLVNVFKYYYIDDDFKLDNIQVNAGVSFILAYKNKKIK